MTTYRYLSAAEWGGVWVRPPVAEALKDPECYVHHTAGNPASLQDAAAAFRALNAYATTPKPNGKGYSFLDYDILVHHETDADIVTIGEGRGPWLSAATLDRNEQGEAVCALGYFHPGHATLSKHPTPEMVEGIARGIVWGMEKGWISRTTTILGHRDNPAHPNATPCPGDYLYPKLPTIRARVAELLDGGTEPMPTYKFFMTTNSPTAVWMVEGDSRIAVRVTEEMAKGFIADGIPFSPVQVTDAVAKKYAFVNSLEPGVVGVT